jgi:asparagine synthase (glutamine-hydrolysing)
MCGIVGIKTFNTNVDEPSLSAMRDTFTYRGPDDGGVWIDYEANLGLAHRRLSIIDTTSNGHQPMIDEAAGLVISYNGEIYNYIEIKEKLKALGYHFKTHTDTEVILKAYKAYGYGCLNEFNGMFAFAIWDIKTQTLFMARDRLGIKPFYYYHNSQQQFIFASECKAILKGLNEKPAINEHLIDKYMGFGYVPGENTLHKGIKRLLPGHYAVLKGDQLQITPYWDLNFSQTEDRGLDYYIENSRTLLNDAIDLRLRSDVPLGIFLSGGIDSSAVVGLLAERVSNPLKTFSVAYDFGKNFNETEYARLVSKKFNTDHHEIFLTPTEFKDFIPDYVSYMDEPVTEAAAISLYFVSKLAASEVTVVLSGEGSDEIFGGYDLYQYMLVIEKYRALLGKGGSKFIANAASLLPFSNKLTKYLIMAGQPLDQRYHGISTYDPYYKNLLYRDDFKNMIKNSSTDADRYLKELFKDTTDNDALSRMLSFDTRTWLVDDLLIKADRMSMANSIELRVPFLDYRLVEFAASIPSKYKVNKGQGKYVLKKMLEGLLPDQIIYRKKMGFPTPLKLMFQNEMKDYAYALLLNSNTKVHQYFEKNIIKNLLDQHAQSQHDHHRVLWQLVVLEEWLNQNT